MFNFGFAIFTQPELLNDATSLFQMVCGHPLFWESDFRLKFLLDVSDRLENLHFDDKLVQRFERGAGEVSTTPVQCSPVRPIFQLVTHTVVTLSSRLLVFLLLPFTK